MVRSRETLDPGLAGATAGQWPARLADSRFSQFDRVANASATRPYSYGGAKMLRKIVVGVIVTIARLARLVRRRWLAVLLVPVMLVAAGGCATPDYRSTGPVPSATCDDILAKAVALDRSGQSGNGYDDLSAVLEMLRTSNCPEQWDVFTDYSSGPVLAEVYGKYSDGPVRCSEISRNMAAMQLLREDGVCEGRPGGSRPDDQEESQQPGGGVAWDEAIAHVGSRERVCGPLASIGSSSDDVFLNIGRDYPDPDRFTVVLWDIGRVKHIAAGTTVCASGRITRYQGVAQIELRSVRGVELYR